MNNVTANNVVTKPGRCSVLAIFFILDLRAFISHWLYLYFVKQPHTNRIRICNSIILMDDYTLILSII
ncbi:hypothetical protein DERF_001569 [Dermatophagoides farinae]|uniref:Uncharacterized protein n=1 Tax=Dermatophagoides farinae TaxID=6954 RepID=A0A922LD14_DERFA|nr:hypothetical protein DERF_001569 [Dermatophagoides farinae]